MRSLLLSCSVAILLLCGCIQISAPPGTPAAVTNSLPVITGFYADPPVITVGQSTNLVWNAVGAAAVTINPTIANVGNSGSLAVQPSATSTYTLIASNGYGSTRAALVVTVNPTYAPPVVSDFEVSPPFVNPGRTATLTWNVSGATNVNIDPGIGQVASSGSQTVYPGYTTTYILTASNSAGVITDSTILSVTGYPTYSVSSSTYPPYPVYPYTGGSSGLPVIVAFNMNPPVVSPGEPVQLSWDIAGANTVSIVPGFGSVAPAGSVTLTPNADSYYTITATNDFGSVSSTATASVYPLPYYNYSQQTVPEIQEPGYEVPEQLPSLVPAPAPIYDGGSGSDYQNQALVVPDQPKPQLAANLPALMPRIVAFNSSPSTVTLGGSSQLRWRVVGATSVSISPDIGFVAGQGSVTVTPARTTVYTITASNAAGVIEHPEEVTVLRALAPAGQ